MGERLLFTIGYENAPLDEVLSRLKAAGVARLVDVRAVAASRRPGFSKSILRASLEAEGLSYRHLRALGTPKAGREAARAGRIGEMREIYARQLETPEAVAAFGELLGLAEAAPSCLLCYEADPRGCHRRALAERMAAEAGFRVQDL